MRAHKGMMRQGMGKWEIIKEEKWNGREPEPKSMSQGRSEKSKKKKLERQMRGTQRNVYVSVCEWRKD